MDVLNDGVMSESPIQPTCGHGRNLALEIDKGFQDRFLALQHLQGCLALAE
jgi:hypothetical protein